MGCVWQQPWSETSKGSMRAVGSAECVQLSLVTQSKWRCLRQQSYNLNGLLTILGTLKLSLLLSACTPQLMQAHSRSSDALAECKITGMMGSLGQE